MGRNQEIKMLRKSTGLTFQKIGEKYNLSRERIRQITNKPDTQADIVYQAIKKIDERIAILTDNKQLLIKALNLLDEEKE